MTSKNTLIVLVLYLIPIWGICGFVAYFSVNVPIYDQWVLPYWFEKFSTGTLTLKNLFAQHNSHRIFFPKLIFIALSFASNWNLKLEVFGNIFLAILTFLFLYFLSQNTAEKPTISFYLANLSTCFLVFSWVQHENWLWGFQIAIFLINLCVVLSCLIISSPVIQPKIKLTLAAILCSIASFTSAQGLLSWLGIIPAVWTLKGNLIQKKKRLLIWLGLFLLSGWIYSINYRSETDTVPVVVVENKIIATIHFFFNLQAAPFFNSSNINWLIGLIIFLLFLGLIFSALFSDQFKTLNPNYSPWISIGLFSLLCSGLIAVGRSGLGADYAIFTSRYTTHTLLLPIAIIQLGQRIIFNFRLNFIAKHRTNQLLVFGILTGLFIGLNLVQSVNAVTYVNSRFPLIQGGKTCVDLINYLEKSAFFKTSPQSCLTLLISTQWRELIWESSEKLQRLNFRNFAENVAFIETPQQTYGEITVPELSDQIIEISTTESVQLEGWINPLKNTNIVLFSLNEQPSFFANAYAINNHSLSAQKIKWEVEFTANSLPAGTSIIRAWIYDPIENKFLKLNHQVSIRIFDQTTDNYGVGVGDQQM